VVQKVYKRASTGIIDFSNTRGIIYVVDSADLGPNGRLDMARDELGHILAEEILQGVPLIVMANKQDLPTAMNRTQVAHGLGLHNLHGRRWHIQGCSAISGNGLYEGLDWLVLEMNR
jgi:signal recognition particle receptor subunit beta